VSELDAVAGPIWRAAPRHNLDVPATVVVAEVERKTNLRKVSASAASWGSSRSPVLGKGYFRLEFVRLRRRTI
jgi:hypothetical protein